MPAYSIPFLCGPSARPHVSLLAINAPAVPASRGICEHDCDWCVCGSRQRAFYIAWITYGAHGHFIGAGVVGDISTRAERGGFFGIFTLGPMVCTVSEQTLFTYICIPADCPAVGWTGDWACDRWSASGPSWLARALLVFVHRRVNLLCDNYSVSNLIFVNWIALIFF